MQTQTLTFRILRFKPEQRDLSRYEDFKVRIEPRMTVLDGLEQIRLMQDATLMYRHCCHHSSCGTCACTINGVPALACTRRIEDLQSGTVTLEPLVNHIRLGDLAVDMASFFQEWDPHWSGHRSCEDATAARTPSGVVQLKRLENCIECGCCVAACPVTSSAEAFMGPAALAAVHTEMRKKPAGKQSLLQIAAGPRGVNMCRRHLACSRVCPSRVYPARHIADLQRALGTQAGGQTSRQ